MIKIIVYSCIRIIIIRVVAVNDRNMLHNNIIIVNKCVTCIIRPPGPLLEHNTLKPRSGTRCTRILGTQQNVKTSRHCDCEVALSSAAVVRIGFGAGGLYGRELFNRGGRRRRAERHRTTTTVAAQHLCSFQYNINTIHIKLLRIYAITSMP